MDLPWKKAVETDIQHAHPLVLWTKDDNKESIDRPINNSVSHLYHSCISSAETISG